MRVVFMGDSHQDMLAQPLFGGFFPGNPYLKGISDGVAYDAAMVSRFSRGECSRYSQSLVVIWRGTNDRAGNTTGPIRWR